MSLHELTLKLQTWNIDTFHHRGKTDNLAVPYHSIAAQPPVSHLARTKGNHLRDNGVVRTTATGDCNLVRAKRCGNNSPGGLSKNTLR